ncbi:MAG: ABC-2 family transporter protein [Lachnospiraceae bacterium]|nr:ABC-2 family transporter protein [Lachnospiraceae bacterium]MBP3459702.1 ABC-2 family transporter protein [Lachnospiraceae bacterium]
MRLYGKYFVIHLKSVMVYKTSFLLTCIGQFLVSFNVFLGVYFMFQRFHVVEGFTYNEALLCFGITLMEFSLAETFARGFDLFSYIVNKGEFDRILVRPRNEILQVLGSRMEFSRIGRIFQAIVMFAYGFAVSDVSWNLLKILTVILMILGGSVVFGGLFLIYASICFFTTEGLEFMNIFTDGAREYGKYPVCIYGKRVLQLCTFMVPYALIQYYPLLYLLDRGKAYYSLLPVVACLFLLPCLLLWKLGVRHYTSSGS